MQTVIISKLIRKLINVPETSLKSCRKPKIHLIAVIKQRLSNFVFTFKCSCSKGTMSLLAFKMTIHSPILESTTFPFSYCQRFSSGWHGSLNDPGKRYNGLSYFEASNNCPGGPAICKTYSLRTTGWRRYWSALMLMNTLPW